MKCDVALGERKRVLLIGLGPTAESALESLVRRLNVIAIVRNEPCDDTDPVCVRARQMGVHVIAPASIAKIQAAVETYRPDCVVVSSFDRILPPSLLSMCPFINVHYALLPRYRGRANVHWAIINGEPATGITIHVMAPGLDAGNILFQAVEPIGATEDASDLYSRLNKLQQAALVSSVERLLAGDHGLPQDESRATYSCTRVPDDGEIDWNTSAIRVHNLVRALAPPFPGAFTHYGGDRIAICRAVPVTDGRQYDGRVCGRVERISRAEGTVDVLCGTGALRLFEVQADGGARTAAANLIRSTRTTLGLRMHDLLKRIQLLERRLADVMDGQVGLATASPRPVGGCNGVKR